MRLAAIYIEDHFLFEKPVIVNLGGMNFYTLIEKVIHKRVNDSFIPNFYDDENIVMLSAIVGKNGSGKSSLLNILINVLNNDYGYTFALIFENISNIYVRQRSNVKFSFDYTVFDINTTSFYYSPYLDFRLDRNGFDLSLDKTIETDLENIDDIRKASKRIDPIQHLKMKGWTRQMEFINSIIGKEFKEVFDLPSNSLNKITFTRYMIDVDGENDKVNFHNTPYGFRGVIQFIYEKIRNEAKVINQNRPEGYYKLVNIQKELFKNYFLMDFICLFIIQMEKNNNYLSEGYLKISQNEFIKNHSRSKALDTFYDFLENHYYNITGREFNLLPIKETKNLINKVYSFIDKAEAIDDKDNRFFDWHNKAIYLEESDAIDILNLQNDFLDKVDNYYRKSAKSIIDLKFNEFSRIRDFINFQPSERNLSSGENALLNLFARFHEIFEKVFSKLDKQIISPLNIILLDEADLGFHPKWKKQFVNFILYFFKVYFKKLNSTVQIIFTTHDPLTLSDVLNYNVVYIDKTKECIILNDELKPSISFGANISDLLSYSFFVDDGLIGDFAKEKIQDVIDFINDEKIRKTKNWLRSPEIAKKLIDQIGEPYLNEKLNMMFISEFNDFKADEIKRLEERINRLKDDSN